MDSFTMDDVALVLAIGRRCPDAIAELHQRHSGAVSALGMRVLGDRSRADDVVQDVFIRLWNRPGGFDPSRGNLRTYLLTMAHSRAIDLLRSEVSRRRREDDELWRNADLRAGYVLDVDGRWEADAVRAALATLPVNERHAIELAYFGDNSYRRVASLLGIPEGTGKARIRAGLRRLSRALSEDAAVSGA